MVCRKIELRSLPKQTLSRVVISYCTVLIGQRGFNGAAPTGYLSRFLLRLHLCRGKIYLNTPIDNYNVESPQMKSCLANIALQTI